MKKKCTILMLTSIDPSWADQGGVIDRFVFIGTQEDINKEIKTCILDWATDFFDLTEEQSSDFRADLLDGIHNTEYTGDYRVLVEDDCTFTDLTEKVTAPNGEADD